MALTTLPYPSLDFVPLDILTAEEMNQIVANYTAINNATIGTGQLANNSITTPKLANKAVTSDKVDWTTLKTGKPTEVGSGIASRTITANSVGFIVINTACANNAYSTVYLNDTSLGRTQGGAVAFTWLQTTVLVAKGDVVRITTSDNGGNAQITGVFFVPIS